MPEQKRVRKFLIAHGRDLLVILLVAVLLWISRFLTSAEFGFYADDISRIPAVIDMTWGELVQDQTGDLLGKFSRARPLHNLFIYFLSFIGWRLGGLQGLYFLAYLVLVANFSLFFLLLRKVMNFPSALIGGLAYALFAADTTQTLLTHAYGLQTAIIFILVASHLLLSRKFFPAYFCSMLSLLCYETPFGVFAAVPLLIWKWDKEFLRKFSIHILITGVLLSASYWIKRIMGDVRTASLDVGDMVVTAFTHMLQGPVVSLGTYGYRAVQVLQSGGAALLAFVLILAVLIALGLDLAWRKDERQSCASPLEELKIRPLRWNSLSEETRAVLRHAAAGLLGLVLAYPLTMTVRAYAISGRDTRVHLAAVIGAAIFIAAVFEFIMLAVQKESIRKTLIFLTALDFACLAGFGFIIQRNYRNAWQYQKDLLNQVLELVPDLEEGMIILVDPTGLYEVKQIDANTWNVARVLEQVYQFPDEWDRPPRILRLTPYWQRFILQKEGTLRMSGDTTVCPTHVYGDYYHQKAVLLLSEDNQLRRITGIHAVKNGIILFREQGEPVLDQFPRGNLYELMVRRVCGE